MMDGPPRLLTVGDIDAERVGPGWLRWLGTCELEPVSIANFPDGELRVCLPRVGARVDVFCDFRKQSTHRFDMQRLLHVCAVARAAKQQGATRLRLITPEVPCMRQDRQIQRGDFVELAGRELVLDLLLAAGVDLVCTSFMKFDVVVSTLELIYPTELELATWLVASGHVIHGAVVALDEGARGLAATVAKLARIPTVTLVKQRDDNGISHAELTGEHRAVLSSTGSVLLVDDLLVSGKSLSSAATVIAESYADVSLDVFIWNVRPSRSDLPAIAGLLRSGRIRTLLTSSLAPGAPGVVPLPAQSLLTSLLEGR